MKWLPGLALTLALLMVATAAADESLDGRLAALEVQIVLDPRAPLPRLRRARLLREAARLDQADLDLQAVSNSAPEHPLLDLERGLLAIAYGEDGRPFLDRHLARPPARAEGFDARARLHETAGRAHAALQDRQAGWTREPTPDRALALATAFETVDDARCASMHLGQAEAELDGAIVIRLERVQVLLRAGWTGQALAAATSLVDDEPRSSDRLLLRADVRQAHRDPAGARRDRTLALDVARAHLAKRPTALARAALTRAQAALPASD
jgi:hypothetical protein